MHEPVLCRYCHSTMAPRAYIDGACFNNLTGKSTWRACYECLTCGSTSPCVEGCKGNREDAIEEAYRLATVEDIEEACE